MVWQENALHLNVGGKNNNFGFAAEFIPSLSIYTILEDDSFSISTLRKRQKYFFLQKTNGRDTCATVIMKRLERTTGCSGINSWKFTCLFQGCIHTRTVRSSIL